MKKQQNEGIRVKGAFRLKIVNRDGAIAGDSGWQENLVANLGFNKFLVSPLGSISGSLYVSHVGLGTGSAPNASHTTLDGEVGTRQAVTVITSATSKTLRVKAEEAYRAGDRATALNAYRNGVSAHIDWVNARNLDNNQVATQITATEKAAYLAAPAIVPTTPAGLTLTHIMSQKYIALWAWGHNEIWMDMRRYRYTDVDPASGTQVYPGFTPPTNLYPDNGGKLVQRIRPRYNSEYVWNIPALEAIGGLALDYHTKPLWITQP